ncbi:MAG: allophanate hydrolase [Gammaproteobacteria bacterium]|nr:MAG: allophanate hydrolase [Gammaproteobacteria bacterium]
MSINVIKSGFLSLVEDYGRFGLAQYGLSQSGVADEHAYCWANHLLDNDFNDAVLEITFGGCELTVLSDISIVLTGADLGFKINDKIQPLWQVINVSSGDNLTWSVAKSGVRAYLAVKGGFQTTEFFNSRSSNLREQIGAKLIDGDLLSYDSTSSEMTHHAMPSHFFPNYEQDLILRLLPTYQFDQFEQHQKDVFFNQDYTISSAYDRTGCRLEGQSIKDSQSKMISEGISYGSVEITTEGFPIILLKDSPTIGGYPKIGTVFSLDLAKLAQRQIGNKVSFELMDIETAQQKRRDFNVFFGIQ